MHTYRHYGNSPLWTVGYFEPDGAWHPLTDFNNERDAMERVNYLNGGNSHVNTYVMEP